MGSLDSQPSRSLRNQRCFWSFVMDVDVVFESPGLTKMQMAMIWLYLKIWARKKNPRNFVILNHPSCWCLEDRIRYMRRRSKRQGWMKVRINKNIADCCEQLGQLHLFFEKLVPILGLSSLCLYRNTGPVFGAPSWTCPAPGSPEPNCFLRIVSCKL